MKNPESRRGEPPVGRLRKIMNAIAAKLGYAPLEDWAPSNEEDPVVVIPVRPAANSDPMPLATITVRAQPLNTEQVPAAPKVSEITTQNKSTVLTEISELRRKEEALKTIETQLTVICEVADEINKKVFVPYIQDLMRLTEQGHRDFYSIDELNVFAEKGYIDKVRIGQSGVGSFSYLALVFGGLAEFQLLHSDFERVLPQGLDEIKGIYSTLQPVFTANSAEDVDKWLEDGFSELAKDNSSAQARGLLDLTQAMLYSAVGIGARADYPRIARLHDRYFWRGQLKGLAYMLLNNYVHYKLKEALETT